MGMTAHLNYGVSYNDSSSRIRNKRYSSYLLNHLKDSFLRILTLKLKDYIRWSVLNYMG